MEICSTLALAILLQWMTFSRIDARSAFYKVIQNKRADLDPIYITGSCSKTECTVRCTETEGCTQVNWLPSRCELLRDTNEAIAFVNEHNARFMYKMNTTSTPIESPSYVSEETIGYLSTQSSNIDSYQFEDSTTDIVATSESTTIQNVALICDVTYDLISSNDYGIIDAALTASSANSNAGPAKSRLNHNRAWETYGGVGEWIQAELRDENLIVMAIRTQGHGGGWSYYITQFSIATSLDGNNWQYVEADNGDTMIFARSTSGDSIETHTLPEPVIAGYVRLIVVEVYLDVALRWSIDGCSISAN